MLGDRAASASPSFAALCARERCPFAVLGERAPTTARCVVDDAQLGDRPIDMPLDVLLGKPPRMTPRRDARRAAPRAPLDLGGVDLARGARAACCGCPTVADKTFLVTIGDRTVGGLVARDQMVGPLAGAGRRRRGHRRRLRRLHRRGDGDRRAHAARAARRGGVGAHGGRRGAHQPRRARRSASSADVKLSANWMAAAGHPGEDARLYDAVRAVGVELCPALGIAIPVGKDSMSMRTAWERGRRSAA